LYTERQQLGVAAWLLLAGSLVASMLRPTALPSSGRGALCNMVRQPDFNR